MRFELQATVWQMQALKVLGSKGAVVLHDALLRLTEWIRPGLRQYRDMQMDKDVCSKSRTEATGSEARRHGRCKCEIGQGESSLSVEGTRRNPTVGE